MITTHGPPGSVQYVLADRLVELNRYLARLAEVLRSNIAAAVARAVADTVQTIVEKILARLNGEAPAQPPDSWDGDDAGGWDDEYRPEGDHGDQPSTSDGWADADDRSDADDRWNDRDYYPRQQAVVASPSPPSPWTPVLAAMASAVAWLLRQLRTPRFPGGPMPVDEAIRSGIKAADPIHLGAKAMGAAVPLVALVGGLRWVIGSMGGWSAA